MPRETTTGPREGQGTCFSLSMPCWAFHPGLPPGNRLPSACSMGHVGPITQLEEVENTRFHREPGSSRFWNLRCQGDMPGSVPGMQEASQNLPRPCERGGTGSSHAKHDLAGSGGGEKHFDVVSGSWNYSLVGSFLGGDLHRWKEAS